MRSRAYGWYILGILASVNFLNYGTRNVVVTMYGDMRGAFGFSNGELGLIGTVFMTSHALVTVPVGWAADRMDRRHVIALGVLVWSVANLASAASVGLGSMLASRAIAGMGTAACVPVANALLCDVFPASRKARTVSIFNIGLFLGGAAGFGAGAAIGFPGAFLAIALPGFALIFAVFVLDVPPRTAPSVPTTVSWRGFGRDIADLLRIPSMRWLLVGAVLMAFAAGGLVAWFADFVARSKGLSIERASALFGVCALAGGVAGVIVGGRVGDWLQARRAYGRMAAMSLGFALSFPFGLLSLYASGIGPVFLISTGASMFFVTWYHGPMAAVVDDLVVPERAATAQAAFIFTMHFFGTAPSSYVVGLLADEVGLQNALLVPIFAVLLAALAIALGFRHAAADCAITKES